MSIREKMRPVPRLLSSIGNNPVVKLTNIVPERCAEVHVLLDYLNPSGSVKDRIAKYMVERAEERGDLHPGDRIVEATSGNTGIAFAMIGAVKGYKVTIVMPEQMSKERKALIEALGADIVCTPGCGSDVGLALAKVNEIRANDPKVWVPDQFSSEDNSRAHEATTAPELVRGVGRDISAFVAGVGTGGTLMGVARYFQKEHIDAEIVAVEPAESAVMSGGEKGCHQIEGIGDGFIPPLMKMDVVDRVEVIASDEAIQMSLMLMREEGIMGGISTGANVAAAIRVAEDLGPGRKVVTLAPDSCTRYFSTALF
jgi:cysteine synthase A